MPSLEFYLLKVVQKTKLHPLKGALDPSKRQPVNELGRLMVISPKRAAAGGKGSTKQNGRGRTSHGKSKQKHLKVQRTVRRFLPVAGY